MNHTTQLLTIVEAMTAAQSKSELDTLKERYEQALIEEAWKMLTDEVKTRIKSMCQEQPKAESKKSHPKLWELSSEIVGLEAAIADTQENDELTDEEKDTAMSQLFEEWLTLGEDFDTKACQIAHYIKNLEALTEARRNEYRRLRELAEQSDKQAERLRGYLVSQMERTGKKRIQGSTANLSLRKKPAKVILNCDPELLPDDFKKVEVTPRLSAIKDYLKANPDCDFAALSTTEEYSVTIK